MELGLSFDEIGHLLSERLHKHVEVVRVMPFASGQHSDGFVVTTKSEESLFIKRFHSRRFGFSFPQRNVSSLLVSHSMMNRSESNQRGTNDSIPSSLGVVVLDAQNRSHMFVPDPQSHGDVYHIQEFGGPAVSYNSMISARIGKTAVDDDDRSELSRILDIMLHIHSSPFIGTAQERNELYNDGLRSIIGHPEYLLMFLHDCDPASHIFDLAEQKEFLGLMYAQMHRFKNHGSRLASLHGDFWGANIFFREDGGVYVVDFSRIPWGDPAFDVGFFISSFIGQFQITGDEYFHDLAKEFVRMYILITGDENIRDYLPYPLGLIASIYMSSAFIKDMDQHVRKKIYTHIKSMLIKGTCDWV